LNTPQTQQTTAHGAAIFRVEGVITPRTSLRAAAAMALGARVLKERVSRLTSFALAGPLSVLGATRGASRVRELAWAGVKGMSRHRLTYLGEEYWDLEVRPSIRPEAIELMETARLQGKKLVLVSDNIDLIVDHLAEALEVDHVVCNHLVFDGTKATGELQTPVVGGERSGQWARQFADQNGIDLARSTAYGAQASDALLLSAIGSPCAVAPDFALRRMAVDNDWPVVEV